MYTCQLAGTSTGTAAVANLDFFELTPADDKPLTVHSIFISQSTEVGDAQEEMLRWAVIRGLTTSGSGGATGSTPIPTNPDDAAAGFTYETMNTTVATSGTTAIVHNDAFNVRTGLVFLPTPEMRPKVHQGQTTMVVRLISTPVDSISFVGTMYVEEG